MRVLVVEDEPDLRRVVARALREAGYAVDEAADGEEGLYKATNWQYDALVLDLMMPRLDGWELLRRMRRTHKTPVLILTARDAVGDRVRGLDSGADDYLVKPFELVELQARLRALIRRAAGNAVAAIEVGDVVVDTAARVVTCAGQPVALTAREYALVELLAQHRGHLITRSMIYEHLFDETEDSLSNLVDVHVSNVRKKLGKDFITTRRGQGYLIDVQSLRWRLLAWHAGILVLTVVGFGVALYYQIRQARLTEIDAELQASARSLEGTLRGFPPPLLDGMLEPPRRPREGRRFDPPSPPSGERHDSPRPPQPQREPLEHRLERTLTLPNPDPRRVGAEPEAVPYFVVWLGNGQVFKASNLPSEIPAPIYDAQVAEVPGRVEVRQRDHFREVVISSLRHTQVLVGRSIRPEQSELTGLAWRLGLTGLGVLGVGLIGGLLLSSRAVRPIALMSCTAASISVSNLDRRIDVKEVDSELGKLASILNEMFARLESAFEQQTRFTADASHELRTPLSVIHSHAELALSRPRSPEEYQETLETCVRASRRMKAIVEGLLTLARSDAGKLELRRQPLDLAALVQDAVSLLEPLAAQKNVHLSVQAAPLEMTGDMTRLAQVVTNLVSNAINYNRLEGSVSVTLESGGGDAVLTVADTGCGIPEEDRPHIFERFYRVDKARSRELGGSGLGLAICKSIVESLGGSIRFTTELNRGTTFVVRLPLGSASSNSEALSAHEDVRSRRVDRQREF